MLELTRTPTPPYPPAMDLDRLATTAIRKLLEPLPTGLRRRLFSGTQRYCPVCESHVDRFLPFGFVPRPDSWCPVCGALPRHRLLWLFLARKTNLLDAAPKRLLHVAPAALEARLRAIANLEYVSGNLSHARAMVELDVTDIQYPDAHFDVIYCSYVLQYVTDDRRALREMHRVLRPDGWAVLQVAMTAPATCAAPVVATPGLREKLLGRQENVRRYGRDFKNRLAEAGFTVTEVPARDVVDRADADRMGIPDFQSVYYCTKS